MCHRRDRLVWVIYPNLSVVSAFSRFGSITRGGCELASSLFKRAAACRRLIRLTEGFPLKPHLGVGCTAAGELGEGTRPPPPLSARRVGEAIVQHGDVFDRAVDAQAEVGLHRVDAVAQ